MGTCPLNKTKIQNKEKQGTFSLCTKSNKSRGHIPCKRKVKLKTEHKNTSARKQNTGITKKKKFQTSLEKEKVLKKVNKDKEGVKVHKINQNNKN